jgi:hypothetical protein
VLRSWRLPIGPHFGGPLKKKTKFCREKPTGGTGLSPLRTFFFLSGFVHLKAPAFLFWPQMWPVLQNNPPDHGD